MSSYQEGAIEKPPHPSDLHPGVRSSGTHPLMPTFLIIGATKSGTSSLYRYLNQHPEIYLSKIKSPHFFAFDQPLTEHSNAPLGCRRPQRYMVTEPEAYQELFAAANPSQARGEASAMYIYYPGTAERIKASIPEIKLVAILRHPVERAYSAFLHQVREGKETLTDFAAALREEPERIQSDYPPLWHYRHMGFYHEQLSRYYATFDRAQLRVFLYEDLQRDPTKLVRDIYRFVGVDDAFIPDTTEKVNLSGVPKNQLLHGAHRFLKGEHPVKTALKQVLPQRLRGRLKLKAITRLETHNLKKPPLDPELRAHLTAVFRDDILKLQTLIGRDLSHWLTY